ncbi:hypothetical protein PN462_11560 [Spirulina sp. CS-785/01]|uniref:hypothetical protein n=1 Tax=Spirulina sp. CS-785/01 TaxID=3021716 RepID=UPI002330F47C|nr:hypothetical protein [Spirulina sp. CS-785/01]MDB9313738.1 hypothetical protein [Spirulina sp. CS-785/01]
MSQIVWRKILPRLFLGCLIGVVSWGLVGCSDRIESSTPSDQTPQGQTTLAEAAPPRPLQQLNLQLDDYQPQVEITTPQPNQVLSDTTVEVQLQVSDLPIFRDETLQLGPHLEVILDNHPPQEVYNLETPLVFSDLEPGTHTLRVFASRPWHESFKNEGAYAQTTFHLFAPSRDNNPDPQLPLLTYNSPQGDYGAEPILLDFYLTNAPLRLVGQDQADDPIGDWRVQVTVNGKSFYLDQWQPIYLSGFKEGTNWVKLDFLDEQGNPVANEYNNTVRVVNYHPQGEDPLSKLVRGEIAVADAQAIVDPDYQKEPEPETESETVEEAETTPEAVEQPETVEEAETTPEAVEQPETVEEAETTPEAVEQPETEPETLEEAETGEKATPKPTEPEKVETEGEDTETQSTEPETVEEPETTPEAVETPETEATEPESVQETETGEEAETIPSEGEEQPETVEKTTPVTEPADTGDSDTAATPSEETEESPEKDQPATKRNPIQRFFDRILRREEETPLPQIEPKSDTVITDPLTVEPKTEETESSSKAQSGEEMEDSDQVESESEANSESQQGGLTEETEAAESEVNAESQSTETSEESSESDVNAESQSTETTEESSDSETNAESQSTETTEEAAESETNAESQSTETTEEAAESETNAEPQQEEKIEETETANRDVTANSNLD